MLNDSEFEKLLKEYDYKYKRGDIIKGTIIGYENGLIVDIRSKSCAYCRENEILLENNKKIQDIFKIGEEYEFIINSEESEDGSFYLSHKKIALLGNLDIIKEKMANNETVIGKITNIVRGGVLVSVMGIKGFVPQSQIKDEGLKIGSSLELKILTCNLPAGDFVLSNKKIYDEQEDLIKQEILDKIELNIVVKGTVVRIADFGAFVDIGGMDGLLPLSQMSWRWIDKPSDVLKQGDVINVEIIGIDKEKQRISLSLKSLEENPWPKAQEQLELDKITKGKITRIKPFGIFVEVFPLVEGLLNKHQVQEYYKTGRDTLMEGDELDVIIKSFDPEEQKISLEIA